MSIKQFRRGKIEHAMDVKYWAISRAGDDRDADLYRQWEASPRRHPWVDSRDDVVRWAAVNPSDETRSAHADHDARVAGAENACRRMVDAINAGEFDHEYSGDAA